MASSGRQFLGPPVRGTAPRPPKRPASEPGEIGPRQLFRRFWPLTQHYRRWLWVALAFVVVSPPLDAAGIWLFKALVDDVLTPHDFSAFPRIAALYIAYTVGSGVIGFGERYLGAWLGERFVTDLRTHVFEHLQSLSLDFFERRRLGDVLSRLGSDVAAIESMVLSGTTSAAGYVLRIVVYAGALFLVDWPLALSALVVTPVFWALSRRFGRRLKDAATLSRRASGEITAIAEESLGNISLVQAYNAQLRETARFREQGRVGMRAQLRSTTLRGIFSPLSELLELVGLLIVIGYGAWQMSHGQLTLGELLVFMAFFGQLYAPVKSLGRFANSMASAAASGERVVELLDCAPSVVSPSRPVVLARTASDLAFDGVTFTYPGGRRPSLDQVSFAIEPGQRVAIVGPSGAGKSSIAKLLLRFYDPGCGAVRIGGSDLRALDLAALREHVAVVMQETLVFDGTLRENIMWGRPDAPHSRFREVVAAADVDSFAQDLPDGYDTPVGQRGRRLSGGQRQRLAIARAMLRDAPVLLLDEATTGLDTETAARVAGPIRALMAGRTTISITHDLTLAQQCDLILVLADGRLVQGGTHQELLGQAGTYRRLYRQRGDRTDSSRPRHHPAAPADDPTSAPVPAVLSAARSKGGTVGSTEWNNRPWWSTAWWREDL